MTKKNTRAGSKVSPARSTKTLVIVIAIAAIAVAGGVGAYFASSGGKDASSPNVGPWTDVHGVGVFPLGSNDSLYLATHNGLFKKDAAGWTLVGSDRSDLMGFLVSPAKEDTMYSSGHPAGGGNLGFRKSTDSGLTWQTISTVTNPPVDFHAMDASATDGNLIYGSPGGGDLIYRTNDEGKTWTPLSPPGRVISLAAHPLDANMVCAGTVSGLYVSNDRGNNWLKAENVSGVVAALGFSDPNTVYAFIIPDQEDGYIAKSTDGGKTLEKTSGQITSAKAAWKFAAGRSGEIYTIVNQNTQFGGTASSVYSSSDGGATWVLEGTNNKALTQ